MDPNLGRWRGMIAKAGLSENKRKNLVLLSNDHSRGKFIKPFSRSIKNLIAPHEASYPFTEFSCLTRRMIECA